jgi:hypothetical protein
MYSGKIAVPPGGGGIVVVLLMCSILYIHISLFSVNLDTVPIGLLSSVDATLPNVTARLALGILRADRLHVFFTDCIYGVIINDCTIVGGCALCFRCGATPNSCYKHL